MNYSILFGVLLSIVLAKSIFCSFMLSIDCGVYSNGCEHITGFPWSSISEYKVACGFDGYVKKVSKTIDFYPDSKCEDKAFITNTYTYELTKKDGEVGRNFLVLVNTVDSAKYDVTLTDATIESSDITEMENRKVICTPKLSEGKTYDLKEVTCKILNINYWSATQRNIGVTREGFILFDGSEEEKTFRFDVDIFKTYKRVSTFLGCWEWWSITLLIVGIIVIIAAIVGITIVLTKKKSKNMPKKK